MAVSQEVVLKVLAQVASAVKDLGKVLELVRSLGSETKSNSPLKLDVQISDGLAKLTELQTRLRETLTAAKGGGKLTIDLDLSKIEKDIKDLSASVKRGVSDVKNSLEGLGKVKTNLGLANKASKEFQEFQAELKKLESQFQGAVNRLNTASRGVTFDPISRSATLARDKVRIAAENMAEFLAKIPAAVTKDEAAFAGLQAKIEALRAAAARLAQIEVIPPGGVPAAASLTSSIGSLEKAFALATAAGQLFFASLVVQKLLDFGKSAVQVASDLQILKGQLEIFVGGPEEAADAIDHLRTVADDVGISFVTLADNFQKFLVPAQAAGFTLQETQQVFDAITISLAGAGKSTEEVNGVFKTFTDVMQKGVIQAEELVKQFANNGIPATALLAKAYGKTTAELRDLTKSHQILARDGVPALAAEMLKVYGPAALKNVESFRSENERFKNEVLDLKAAFGNELLPALVEVLQTLKGFDGKGTFGELGADVATIIRLLGDVTRIFNDLKNFNFTSAFAGVDVLLLNLAASAVKSFGIMEVAAANVGEALGLAPEGFSEAVQKSVDSAVAQLRFAAKEARKFGEEARAGAEEGGKGVKDLGDNWEKLYEDLKRQQAEHQKNSGKSEEEITKKQAAEIKKREGAYRTFFQALADLAKEDPTAAPALPAAPSSVSGPDVKAGDASSLDQLRADLAAALAAKRELELQPSVSTEDVAQIDAYRRQIQDLEQNIRTYGASASEAANQASAGLAQSGQAAAEAAAKVQSELGAKTLDALRQLVTGTEGFAQAFTELSPKAQAAVTGIIAAFEQAAASGNLTKDGITAFGQALVKAFQDGGLVGQQFAQQLAASLGTTGTAAGSLAQTLRGLADGSIKAGTDLAGVGDAAAAAAPPIETAATAVRRAGESAKEFDERVRSLIDTSGQGAEAVRNVGQAADETSGNFIGMRDEAGNVGPNLLKVAADSKEAKIEVDGVAVAAASAAENFIGVRDAAGNVGPNLLEVKNKSKEAKEGVDELSKAEPPTKLAEGLESTAASAEKVVEPIKSIGESAAKLGEATQVEGAAKLGEALTTLAAPAAALAPPLELVAGAASRLAQAVTALLAEPGLGTIESQLTPLLEPIQALAEPAARLGEAITRLGQATQTVKAEGLTALAEAGAKLSTIAEPAGAAAASLVPLTEASTALGTSFTTTNTGASTLSASLQSIGTALTGLLASISDPALTSGLTSFGEALATAAPDLATVATELDRFGKALEASKVALPEVQAGIEAIAESVGKPEVKEGLQNLSGSIDKIAASATGAGDGLVVVGKALAAIATSTGKAASGLAEIAKVLDPRKIQEGADALGKLGTSGASAATGTKSLAEALKSAKTETDLLKDLLTELVKVEIQLREEALRIAPAIQNALATAFKQLNVPVLETKDHLKTISEAIDYIGTIGRAQVQALTGEVRELAAAWLQAASAAAAAKQAISGVRLPPVVSQSGAS